MVRFKVVPHRYWRNLLNSRTVSIHGAMPFTSDADAKNWRVVENGYTIYDAVRGTYGVYACPAGSSKEHAEGVAAVLNNMHKMPSIN